MEPDTAASDRIPHWWLVGGAALIVAVVVLQQRGLLVHDDAVRLALRATPLPRGCLGLLVQPGGLRARAEPARRLLLPDGPVHGPRRPLRARPMDHGEALDRLLLVLAWWGTARLADELEIGTPPTRVVGRGGLCTLPVLHGPRRRDLRVRAGRRAPAVGDASVGQVIAQRVDHVGAHAAQRSQSPSSAGANAAVTVSVLVVPVVWLATRSPGPRRRSLAGWWAAAVAAAMAWWFIPLALQSRYGTDFFPISEQADATTQFTAPFQVLRGAADWVGHLRFFGEPHLVPAWVVAHSELVIVASGLLAAAGVVGLATRTIPQARFLRISLLVGLAIMSSAHDGGVLGNPFSDRVLDLLSDGPLTAFRTVYKFQPVVLLPVALGIAHVATRVRLRRPRRPATCALRRRRRTARRARCDRCRAAADPRVRR